MSSKVQNLVRSVTFINVLVNYFYLFVFAVLFLTLPALSGAERNQSTDLCYSCPGYGKQYPSINNVTSSKPPAASLPLSIDRISRRTDRRTLDRYIAAYRMLPASIGLSGKCSKKRSTPRATTHGPVNEPVLLTVLT